MSKTVIINQHDGGHAEDIRTFATNESTSSVNFDIYTNPTKISPLPDMIAETITSGSGIMTDFDITDVIACDISGTTKIVGYGRKSSASTEATFFEKSSSSDITSAFELKVSSGGATPRKNTLVEYKGFAYAMSSATNLVKFTPPATWTDVGTITGGLATDTNPKPFVHPEDGIMYIAKGYVIAKYDGSTLTNSALVLPSTRQITSLTNYGTYLAIATKPASGVGNSLVYLWGRDTSLTTLQGIINWGDGALEILENINETLIGISETNNIGSYTTNNQNKFTVSYYAGGGNVTPIKEFVRDSGYVLKNYKVKHNNRIYFGFDTDNAIWVCGKNKEGRYFVAKNSYITPTGSFITGTLDGISIVGDILFTSYTDAGVGGYLARTSTTYVNESVFITSVNQKMELGDRYKDKQLKHVQLAYEVDSTNATVALGYYNDDNANLQTVISKNQTALGQYVTQASADSNALPFLSGREYVLRVTSVGNASIKEIKYVYDDIDQLK